MDIKNEIIKNKALLIEILEKLVSHNSVENLNEEKTPFGVNNRNCLKQALDIANSFGLYTKNLDNYCGYAELGEGKDIIGIATHLDIVPAGNNWTTDPFKLTEKDGFLYGRGTSDDKGAASASLIALKIIKDLNLDLNNKRIRLLFGCNEETGFRCMKHYNEVEESFTYGFTPDSEFPCVIGEKGHIKCSFKCTDTSIIDIKGGTVPNAVCDKCEIKIKSLSYNKEALTTYLYKNNLSIEIKEQDDYDTIIVIGKATHASMPELGINAITYLMRGLKEANYKDNFINNYCELIDLNNTGEYLNISCQDDYGNLTMVNGTIKKENNAIIGSVDIRVPVTISTEETVSKIKENKNKFITLNVDSYSKSIFYEENSHLVKSLMKAYQDVTKDYESRPRVSGGGTYAKALKNCIAFGCEFPNNENNIHDANERVSIEELLLQVELYIHAIIELSK